MSASGQSLVGQTLYARILAHGATPEIGKTGGGVGISSNRVAARRAGRMGAVLDMVCRIGTIAQSTGIGARTIQSAQQLVRLGRAVAASGIVGKRWMSHIDARIEHGNDDSLTFCAGAARGTAVPSQI